MTVVNISQLLDFHAIQAEKYKRSLKEFFKGAWHIVEPGTPFVDGVPIDAMIKHLEALTRGDIKRLLINIPPRCTKSTLCSVVWRVWSWLHDPSSRFLCASYSLDLSTRDNRRCRNLIESQWFQERFNKAFTLAPDQIQKRFFENDQKGYQMSVSVSGAVTGQGGDFLVIDDAHSATDAHSAADRDTALRWFREVWTNRLNSQEHGRMLVIGQRVHESDVSGYILKERPDWIHLNLPAYFEPSRRCITPLWSDPRVNENDLLWPERFNKEALEGLKRDLGSIGFSSQYQQSPVPSSGGQFKQKWFRHFTDNGNFYTLQTPEGEKRILKSNCHNVATIDLAISLKQTADFTVVAIWAVTPDNELLLIDRLRERLDNPEQQKQIILYHQRYLPTFIDIESTAYQLSIIQQLRAKGLPVREYSPRAKGDKATRATTAAVLYEAGRVYHPLHFSWLHEWEDELLKFPLAAHDDQVDTVSMVCDSLSRRSNTTTSYKSPWR